MTKCCLACGAENKNDNANFCQNCGAKLSNQETKSINGRSLTANSNVVKGDMSIDERYTVSNNHVNGTQINAKDLQVMGNLYAPTSQSGKYQLEENKSDFFEWISLFLYNHFSEGTLVKGAKGSIFSSFLCFMVYILGLDTKIGLPFGVWSFIALLFFLIAYVINRAIDEYEFRFCGKCNKEFAFRKVQSVAEDIKGELVHNHSIIETTYECQYCKDTKYEKEKVIHYSD